MSTSPVTFERIMTIFANELKVLHVQTYFFVINVLFCQLNAVMNDVPRLAVTFFTQSTINHHSLLNVQISGPEPVGGVVEGPCPRLRHNAVNPFCFVSLSSFLLLPCQGGPRPRPQARKSDTSFDPRQGRCHKRKAQGLSPHAFSRYHHIICHGVIYAIFWD